MKFDFSTLHMSLEQREDIWKNHPELHIPIGTKIYAVEHFTDWPEEIIVTEDNQKLITMFWNSIYFETYKKAESVAEISHAEYSDYLYRSTLYM